MPSPRRKSFYSPLLRDEAEVDPTAEAFTMFGCSWQEVVGTVIGVRVLIADNGALTRIENMMDHDPAHLRSDAYSDIDGHFFQLVANEHITRVDVRMVPDEICGFSIHTNLRISQWFGCKAGKIKYFVAPSGYCIHALYGTGDGSACRQFGVLFRPLEPIVPSSLSRVPIPSGVFLKEMMVEENPQQTCEHVCKFSQYSDDVRAMVVQCSDRVEHVWALYAAEYERFLDLRNEIVPKNSEHWLELVPHEVVVRVEVLAEPGRVHAIKFITNFRKTQWMGGYKETLFVTRSRGDDGVQAPICGFVGSNDPHRGCVASLGIVRWLGSVATAPMSNESISTEAWTDEDEDTSADNVENSAAVVPVSGYEL